MALVWMLCRIGLISSDLAAAKALIPPNTLAGSGTVPVHKRSGSVKSHVGVWAFGLSCGAGLVFLCSLFKVKRAG